MSDAAVLRLEGKLFPTPRATEVRVVNTKTGGEKGSKARRFSLIPWRELGDVAMHYAAGAKKYAAHNWRKGYDWSLSADSDQS